MVLQQNDEFDAFFNITIRLFKKNYVILHIKMFKKYQKPKKADRKSK